MNQFNQTIRTLLMVVVVGMAGLVGYKGYEMVNAPARELAEREKQLDEVRGQLTRLDADLAARQKEIASLQEQAAADAARIAKLEEERERLETSLRLMKLRRRLARIDVLEQAPDPDGQLVTRFRFVEIGDDGQALGDPVELMVEGDRIYIEYLVVKFEDKYIEAADLERGTAICLFERIFGEKQEPETGYVIDQVGTRPTAYERGTPMSEVEKKIWDDFWTIANDPQKAAELGISASHAQAPSIRVEPGVTYELDLRSTGDFTLQRAGEKPARVN